MMPVMDGMELLSKLKADDQLCRIPVIMLTARTGLDSKLQALRIGIDDYLTKPFHEEELQARIANLLRHVESRKMEAPSPAEKTEKAAEEPLHSAADLKWLQEVEQRILQGIGDSRFNLGELADQLALSPRRLQQKIKSLTGLTPKQYQREIQLEQARRLLESGDFATVAEVSYQVGFDAPHYFSSLYQKRYGKKPGSY
jgi:DNA-binding response OmpR family regulator